MFSDISIFCSRPTIPNEGDCVVLDKMREGLVRLIQFGLGLDGLLHLGAFGMAIYEEAFGTAIITGLQSALFFTALYFVGHDHTHHKGDEQHE